LLHILSRDRGDGFVAMTTSLAMILRGVSMATSKRPIHSNLRQVF